MNPLPLFLIIVTLPLLLEGRGSEEPVAGIKPIESVAETKAVEEKQEEVKTEEYIALPNNHSVGFPFDIILYITGNVGIGVLIGTVLGIFIGSKRNKIKIPFKSVGEIKATYNFHNLQSFLDIYYQGAKVLITEQDFFDLTWAYLLKSKEDNIVHTEIFFDPQAHTNRGIKFDLVINGIHRAIFKAEKELGISSKIIMCFLRHLDENSAFKTLDEALIHKDKIIGVGLDLYLIHI